MRNAAPIVDTLPGTNPMESRLHRSPVESLWFAVPAEITQPDGHGAADDDQAPQWRES